ncbi:MAG: hypothetical protein NC242_05845 [Roseburia sp.]|nr:hypothetical protein [Roseburia sp.]
MHYNTYVSFTEEQRDGAPTILYGGDSSARPLTDSWEGDKNTLYSPEGKRE